MQPQRLLGTKVELRPAGPADLQVLVRWLHNPEVYRWWGGQPVTEEEIQRKYIGGRGPRVNSYFIEEGGAPVGYAQSWRADESSGGIDMFLAPAARGRGLGRDAARALAGHLTTAGGWRLVTADPEPGNSRGLAFWLGAGFVPNGRTTAEGNPELAYRPGWGRDRSGAAGGAGPSWRGLARRRHILG
jgi:aminoglycoside 6'-N-acetyltransferase